MPKLEKGILGYGKDPKNQILFSFGVRDGDEWPSDDSEDSDYNPGTEPIPAKAKLPAKKPRKGSTKSKRERSSVESSNSENESIHSDSSDTIIESTIMSECHLNKNLNLAPNIILGSKGAERATSFGSSQSVSSTSNENPSQSSESTNHLFSPNSTKDSGFNEHSSLCVDSKDISAANMLLKAKIKKGKGKRKKHKLSTATDQEPPVKKKKKDKEKKKKLKQQKSSLISESENKEGTSLALNLPPEILLRIFRLVVSSEGALPFLCRAARVCKMWYHTSCSPALWTDLDLSCERRKIKSQERYLVWLATHRIPLCQNINLTKWKLLSYNGIQALSENCTNLSSINLSHCPKVTSKAVQLLADHCPLLARIDLSATSTEAVSQASLKYLLERVGKTITHLTLGNNTLKGFNSVLTSISTSCPNLELLDVSNVFLSSDYLSFNVEKFQEGCPKLRILRFVGSKVRVGKASQREQVESPGFPGLEELSIAVNTHKNTYRLAMGGDVLSRFLKNSAHLKILDVRGWAFYSLRSFIHLPATDVEQLLISQNNVNVTEDFGFELVMQKWRHSLVEVDLSWNSYRDNVLDAGIQVLTEFPSECKVEVLDLAGTNVECSTVRTILHRCPRLRVVNLSSCRSLNRGIKRAIEGGELEFVRTTLDKDAKEEKAN